MNRWFVAHTQPLCEAKAVEHLARQGFETYLPRYRKSRSHARRISEVSAPLFPRYVFVTFDPDQPVWRAIRSTRGIIDLVRSGIDPVPVPSDIIAAIRAREDNSGHIPLGTQLDLHPGDALAITGGAFARHTAIFQARRDNERVIALLSLLGREFSLEIPAAHIAPAH